MIKKNTAPEFAIFNCLKSGKISDIIFSNRVYFFRSVFFNADYFSPGGVDHKIYAGILIRTL
jgi:hypothetical protein